ncbi:MAG: hypothetical protein JST33_11000 [Actinobacteria bacterium]|nr:hypothetical protein [Actinomycetota bacterium]
MPATATSGNGSNEGGAGRPVSVQRRTLLKGAAWSLPAIAVATAAPRAAASTPKNALAGVFYVRRESQSTVTWDGRASSSGRLYVTETLTGQKITTMSLRFGSTKPVTAWTKAGGGNCWSLPVADGQLRYAGRTFFMYRSDYTCSLPIAAASGDTTVDSEFYWRGTVANPTELITQRVSQVTQPPSNAAPGTTITWIRNVATI